jgi:uncharacterized repeat protein (TIGR01451 family)
MSRKTAILTASGLCAVAAGVGLYSHNVMAGNIQLHTKTDCNYNSVMYCGAPKLSTLIYKYDHGDGHGHSHANIAHIYSAYGISSTDIHNMIHGHTYKGVVYKNGTITARGEVVATDSISAGRHSFRGTHRHSYAGTTYYDSKNSDSFLSNSIPAYVVMKNNTFQYAILGACGNPVRGHAKTPSYTVSKGVRVGGQGRWHNTVNVKPGTKVEYHIRVRSTGQIAARNINVRDNLPDNVQYAGGLRRSDSKSARGLLGNGNTIGSLKPGHQVTYTFYAKIAPNENVYTCKEEEFTNRGTIKAPGLHQKGDNAYVKEYCSPKPAYACNRLSADRQSRNKFRFHTDASATHGAQITGYSYDFGDGQSKTGSKDVRHTYAQAGNYTAKVTVHFNLSVKGATSKTCQTNVAVNHQPTYACQSLTATKESRTKFTFHASASGNYGANVVNYTYHFGDNSSKTTGSSTTHTYSQPGKKTATVYANVKVNGQTKHVTSNACQTTFTVKPKPVYVCNTLTSDKQSRTKFTFHTKATAKHGAKVTGYTYDFGDNQTKNAGKTVTHTYTQPGTYKTTVTVHFNVPGKGSTNKSCATHVTVGNAPAAQCKSLTLTALDNRTVTAKVVYTTSHGAKLKNIHYDFGDSESKNTKDTSASHTYAKDNTYTVTATLSFTASESVPNETCKDTVTVVTPCQYNSDIPASSSNCYQPCQYNANLPANSSNCYQPCQYDKSVPASSNKCQKPPKPCKYNANIPANSKDCYKPCKYNKNIPATSEKCVKPCQHGETRTVGKGSDHKCHPAPTVLPNTGPGATIALFAGTSLFGGLGYSLAIRRWKRS